MKVGSRKFARGWAVALLMGFALVTSRGKALDLVTFARVTVPLSGALTTLATLTPGVKAIVGVVGFVVAFIDLSALRSFGAALCYVGVAIFGSVGLVVAGAILGATI